MKDFNLRWAVLAKCEAFNGGHWEQFYRVIALFADPFAATDYIDNFLPAERRDSFMVRNVSEVEA